MTKKVISVHPQTKIGEVADILIGEKIHGVPVVDNNNKVIGIITEIDLFIKGKDDLYIPSFIDFLNKDIESWKIPLQDRMRLNKILNANAADIMTRECITVSPDDNLEKILDLFKQKSLYTLPVTTEKQTLCGIITLSDLIPFIKI